jgi:hypothetical protein
MSLYSTLIALKSLYPILIALGIIITPISGGISIYEFIKKQAWKPGFRWAVVAVVGGCIVVMALVLANINPSKRILVPTPTATKVLVPTATEANLFPTPTYSPFLNDPLNHQDANKWDDKPYNDGGCQFTGGFYEASGTQEGSRNYCGANAASDIFTNFVYEVQMRIIIGDCGGLLFRIGSIPSDAYSFEVCQNGTYDVAVYTNDTPTYLINLSQSPAIHIGNNQDNLLAVIAKGNSLTFYVNNQKVGNVNDSTYSAGQIAIFAHAHANYPTEVAFSNAKVWLIQYP